MKEMHCPGGKKVYTYRKRLISSLTHTLQTLVQTSPKGLIVHEQVNYFPVVA
jgi:hypothetical protein